MIYGKECAQIEDEHGQIRITVDHHRVTIKQDSDLIRTTRESGRELAADLVACLDDLEAGGRTQAGAPQVTGVGRDAGDITGRSIFVAFERSLSNDELRAFHDFTKGWRK